MINNTDSDDWIIVKDFSIPPTYWVYAPHSYTHAAPPSFTLWGAKLQLRRLKKEKAKNRPEEMVIYRDVNDE